MATRDQIAKLYKRPSRRLCGIDSVFQQHMLTEAGGAAAVAPVIAAFREHQMDSKNGQNDVKPIDVLAIKHDLRRLIWHLRKACTKPEWQEMRACILAALEAKEAPPETQEEYERDVAQGRAMFGGKR